MRKPLGCPVVLACVMAVLSAGCGGGYEDVAPVTGKVTLDGEPLADAMVEFTPEDGRPSSGMTDSEGRYELMYTYEQPGAEVGVHSVRISTAVAPSDEAAPTPPERVPAKYNENTELTEEVEPGSNVIDFELTTTS